VLGIKLSALEEDAQVSEGDEGDGMVEDAACPAAAAAAPQGTVFHGGVIRTGDTLPTLPEPRGP
jgi:hypothetical protein